MKSNRHALSFLLKEIDSARCNEQWCKVIDLIKRYRKANHQHTFILDIVAIEAEFYRHLEKRRQGQDSIDKDAKMHLNDTPFQLHLFLTPPRTNQRIQSSINELEHIIRKNCDMAIDQGMDAEEFRQLQYAKIILARMHFEQNEFDIALSLLQDLAILVPTDINSKENEGQHYGLILLVQARAMKGICLSFLPVSLSNLEKDLQNNDIEALKAFEAGWFAANRDTEAAASSSVQKYAALFYWSEVCLYYACLMQLKKSSNNRIKDVRLDLSTQNVLKLFRAYSELIMNSNAEMSPHVFKQWVILRLYVQYLLDILTTGVYQQDDRNFLMGELQEKVLYFEILFTRVVRRLSIADEQNRYSIQACKLLMQAYEFLWDDSCITLSPFAQQLDKQQLDKQQLDKQQLTKRALQFFHYARAYTPYDSPTILRFIVITLIKLSRQHVTYRNEARLTLLTYLKVIGISSGSMKTGILCSAESILEKGLKGEALDDVLEVMSLGVYLYGYLLARGPESVKAASPSNGQVAVQLAHAGHELMTRNHGKIHKNMQRMYLSASCLAPAIPTLLSNESSNSKSTTVKDLLNTILSAYYDRKQQYQKQQLNTTRIDDMDGDWKSLYVSGIKYAMDGYDIAKAIEQVQKSLEQNPDHVHSWHLLALLYSCPVLENTHKAPLARSLEFTRGGIAKCLSLLCSDWPVNETQEVAEALMDMKMTELLLVEKIEGAEQALEDYQQAFKLYGQLSDLLEIDLVGNDVLDRVDSNSSCKISISPSIFASTSAIGSEDSNDVGSTYQGRSSSLLLSRRSSRRQTLRSSSISDTTSTKTSAPNWSISVTRSGSFSTIARIIPKEAKTDEDEEKAFSSGKQRHQSRKYQRDHLRERRKKKSKHRQRSVSTSSMPLAFVSTQNLDDTEVQQKRQRSTSTSYTSSMRGIAEDNLPSTRSISMTTTERPSLASNITGRESLDISRAVSENNFYKRVPVKQTAVQTVNATERILRWRNVLVSLWLMVVNVYAVFSTEQKGPEAQQVYLKEAYRALSEAEQLDPKNAELWYQLGRLSLLRSRITNESEMKQVSLDAFFKAAVLNHEYSQLALATKRKSDLERFFVKAFRKHSHRCNSIFHNADVWYEYAQVLPLEATDDEDTLLKKKCLLHASELHDITPIRRLSGIASLPRFIP